MTPRRAGTAALLVALGLVPVLAGAGSAAGAATASSPIPDNALVTSTLQDSFDGPAGSAPNSSMWQIQTDGGPFSHKSLATYTTSPDNVSLDGNGHLRITVRKDTSGSTPVYSSGFLTSKSLVGPDMHIEARIKAAGGYGTWPLFWIEGVDAKGIGWPATGEVDVMENIGKLPYSQWATAHGLALSGGNYAGHWKSTTIVRSAKKLSARYHVYALDVTPSALVWSMDGHVYKVLHKSDLQPTWLWSFNAPFEVILNVDVGGPFPDNPKPTTKFPTTMSVDYVKVTPN